jgi:hypothetical protein
LLGERKTGINRFKPGRRSYVEDAYHADTHLPAPAFAVRSVTGAFHFYAAQLSAAKCGFLEEKPRRVVAYTQKLRCSSAGTLASKGACD